MEHYYKQLPGWAGFENLYREVVKLAPQDRPSVFVEIGSWLGRSAALMGVEVLNSGKPIVMHCVDPWLDGGPDLRDTKYFKDLKTGPYETFLANVKPVAAVLNPMRMPSLEAAKLFVDGTLDFVMIDGDHSYEACKADIEAWLPKVRPGGIISGDDYLWPGVKQAAHEAFGTPIAHIHKTHDDYRKSVAYWYAVKQ